MLIRIPRIIPAIGATVLLGAALVATGGTPPAQAHSYLASSTPESGSTLIELPDSFAITTNDELLAVGDATGGFALQVVGPDGLYYGDGCVTVTGPTMTSVSALGPAGDYTLAWQVLSADGHTVSDQFAFAWAPASEAEISEGSATAPVCGEASPDELPEPQATEPQEEPAEATPAPTSGTPDDAEPDAVSDTTNADDSSLATTLWIGGVVVALAAAAVVIFLLVDRRRKA